LKYIVLLSQTLFAANMRLKSNARQFLEETQCLGKLHVVHIVFFGRYFHYEAP